uniref:Non-specific serine/threonine protein kinase n=1 Tax=Rhabditophanes sp. KR3021 TaxID=114890 RepID=A0AC35U5U8_9BILA
MKVKSYSIDTEYSVDWNSELGIGQNGKVIICTSKQTSKQFALKVLGDCPRARRETEIHYMACSHPHIVKILDVFANKLENQNCLLVIMECMTGGELFSKIQKRSLNAFTEKEAASIVFKICSAVEHLHKLNIAHRDIKPENLLLTDDTDNAVLKLTDFGFAKQCKEKDEFSLETPCYTPLYVAPEVLCNGAKYDKSCDAWSIGVITYILLCGYPPFFSTHGEPVSPGMKLRIQSGKYEFPNPEWEMVSGAAKDFIKKLLSVDPSQRLDIKGALSHKWITHYNKLPTIVLYTQSKLKEEKIRWHEVTDEMEDALSSMRIGNDDVQLKKLPESNNPLLIKRREKNKPVC